MDVDKIPWRKVNTPWDDGFESGRYLCWLNGYALVLWYWEYDGQWHDTGWGTSYTYNEVTYCALIESPDGKDYEWLRDDRG